MTNKILALFLCGFGAISCAATAAEKIDFSKLDLSNLPPPTQKTGLTYANDIRPLFEASCFRCHGEERQRGELRLDTLEEVLKGGEDGKILVPGKSKESLLVVAVAQIDDETAMPPKRRPGGPGRGGGGPGDFGGGRGNFGPGTTLATQLLSQGDKNGDQKLSKAEFAALADVWFDKLDPDKTGTVTQEQFGERFGSILAPPSGARPAGGARGFRGGFVGNGLFGAADSDKNGSLTRSELKQTFSKWATEWDTEKGGSLSENNLRDGLNAALPRPNFGGPNGRGAPGGGRGPGGPGGGFGPPPKPLTPEQVGLVRAWIDQGAK
jgi:hypothetical protein